MAVTGFWPIYKNLKATLDYADNPDKTTAREYLDDDLYAALSYAENDNKTDRKMYVGGINCSKQNAYSEMIAVQRRFGLRGKVVGYHGIQSFKTGEVTPEQAFEIGMETARRMWGCGSPVETSDCNSNQKHRPSRQARPGYQVLVTVHLNTDNVHCHFVVNPVSFKDGAKFQNKIGDHKELRKVSDAICREHGLSVLENSNFYGGNKKDYWRHKAGKKTHRDYLREDVEYCLTFATSPREFESQLYALGYKSYVKNKDIQESSDILRIECKVGYEYRNSICKRYNIEPTFENLFNKVIAQEATIHQLNRCFGSGNFYSKKSAEKIIADKNLNINLNIPISELSEYKYGKFKKNLEDLGICPYGFIPEEWGIEKLDNPINLILNK